MRTKAGTISAIGLAIGFFILLVTGCTMVVQPTPEASTNTTPAAAGTTDTATPPIIDIPGEFAAIQLILDIEPGAWTPVHKHGGPGMITVLDGVMTVQDAEGNKTEYKQGETWYEVPELYHAAGNDGTDPASIAVTFLLPKGGTLTTPKEEGTVSGELPPGPTLLYSHRITMTEPLGEFEAIQLILDIEPGAWTPVHKHGGPGMITVLDGAMTVQDAEGNKTEYKTGETWEEVPELYHAAGNDGTDPASIAVLFLLPKGGTLTTAKEGTNEGELPPGPTLLYQGRFTSNNIAAQ
jgi:quercetin dioxygenase-like cupin family protein